MRHKLQSRNYFYAHDLFVIGTGSSSIKSNYLFLFDCFCFFYCSLPIFCSSHSVGEDAKCLQRTLQPVTTRAGRVKKPVLSGTSLNTRVPIRVVPFHYYFCLFYWHIGKIVWKKPVSLSYMHNFAINFRIRTRTYATTSITGFSIFTRRQKYRVNSIAKLNEKNKSGPARSRWKEKEKIFFRFITTR